MFKVLWSSEEKLPQWILDDNNKTDFNHTSMKLDFASLFEFIGPAVY